MRSTLLPALLLFAPACAVVVNEPHDHANTAPAITHAVCVLRPTQGNETVSGSVSFTQLAGGVLIEATVTGLKPGLHGFHVHEWGDLDCKDGLCTGGHFNPTGEAHGAPTDAIRHLGDFGNLEADASGKAQYRRVDSRISLIGEHGIVGRGIVVHAGPDDLHTQPTGNAGARLATGVIGIGNPAPKP